MVGMESACHATPVPQHLLDTRGIDAFAEYARQLWESSPTFAGLLRALKGFDNTIADVRGAGVYIYSPSDEDISA
eukprot:scaffold24543_cov195-Amphora_coffeaeformis.AAC.13